MGHLLLNGVRFAIVAPWPERVPDKDSGMDLLRRTLALMKFEQTVRSFAPVPVESATTDKNRNCDYCEAEIAEPKSK